MPSQPPLSDADLPDDPAALKARLAAAVAENADLAEEVTRLRQAPGRRRCGAAPELPEEAEARSRMSEVSLEEDVVSLRGIRAAERAFRARRARWQAMISAASPTAAAEAAEPEADEALRLLEAERDGLRLAALCRAGALGALALWVTAAAESGATTLISVAALGAFASLGLAHRAVVGTARERPWMKYAAVAADYLLLAGIYVLVPVSSAGGTPQILAFRAVPPLLLVLPIALATLSLSPRLVLFSGAAATTAWWGAFLIVIAGMERRLSWSDLPSGAGLETWETVFLDPDFVGVGSRVVESVVLLSVAGALALAVGRARGVLRARFRAEAERALIARTFGEYVPAEAARLILENREGLAPSRRRASVLAIDLEGFTGMAETLAPEAVIACLNAFFSDAAEVVAASGGVIVDFSGDGFIAAFNAPIAVPDPEARAVEAARALLSRAAATDYAGRRLRPRAGLATGEVAAGSVGGAGRRTYTVYGDPVNLAARLQARAKTLGLATLLDGETAAGTDGARRVEIGATVRGRRGAVDLWTLDA